eukprot:363878-Chlamydomonas_euryale.AAC.10
MALPQLALCDPVDAPRPQLFRPASAPRARGCFLVHGCKWRLPQPPTRRFKFEMYGGGSNLGDRMEGRAIGSGGAYPIGSARCNPASDSYWPGIG